MPADGAEANFVEIINSRWVRLQLLYGEYEFNSRTSYLGKEMHHKETLASFVQARNWQHGLARISPFLECARDQKTEVITVSAETPSRELSMQLVERELALLEVFVQEKGRTHGGAKALFAQARLGEARVNVDAARDAFRVFLNVNRNYQSSPDPAVRLRGQQLEMELKLRETMMFTLAQNYEQALMEEKNDIPVLNILDPPQVSVEKTKPSRARMVMSMLFLGCLGSLGWTQRHWLKAFLFEGPTRR